MIAPALAGLRARRSRTVLAGLGIVAASLVVGTAVTVGFGLATGFERAADQADLPDIIARFDDTGREELDERVRALPNLAARSYRFERTNIPLTANGRHTHKGAFHVVMGERRGYLVAEGRDLSGRAGEVVAEQGLAREWDLEVGDAIDVGRAGPLRLVGIAVSPDNVAYPLARAARVYLPDVYRDETPANLALLWLNDPSKADVTLTQARSVSFGLGRLEFVTRDGVKVLLGQAAGIVISLLVAFSLVALVAAGTMLAAGAHAEVQRRLREHRGTARAGLLPGPDRRAAGHGGRARRRARGRGRHRRRRAGRGRPVSRAARLAQRAPAGLGAARPAGRRAGRRGRDRRRRRHLARLAGRAPPAGHDPARRRAAPTSAGGGCRGAGSGRSARGSPPRRAGGGSPRWRRSASAPASSP